MLLDDLDVEPLPMTHGNTPEYRVRDAATGDVYTSYAFYSGGIQDDPDVPRIPVVALYVCEGKKLVVKALPPGDESREHAMVSYASSSGVVAPARVAYTGGPYRKGDPIRPGHFTVVLLLYCGDSLYAEPAMDREAVLRVLVWAADACKHLMDTRRVVYTDFKPSNVLRNAETNKLTLCDYGGMAFTGETFGTATYPPPESPYGNDVQADERAVAYGLGVLLVTLHAKKLAASLLFRPEGVERDTARVEIEDGCARAVEGVKDEVLAAVLRAAWAPGATIADVMAAMTPV